VPGDSESSCREMNIVAGPAKCAGDECQKKAEHEQQKNFLLSRILVAITRKHDSEILMSYSE